MASPYDLFYAILSQYLPRNEIEKDILGFSVVSEREFMTGGRKKKPCRR